MPTEPIAQERLTNRRVGGLLASYLHRQMVGPPTLVKPPMAEEPTLLSYLGEIVMAGGGAPTLHLTEDPEAQPALEFHEMQFWIRVAGELVSRRVTVRVEVE